jgi:hypothetical protein
VAVAAAFADSAGLSGKTAVAVACGKNLSPALASRLLKSEKFG